MKSLLAATLGLYSDVAASLVGSGEFGVALPCASAERSRVLPEVFDDSSSVCRRLSPRESATIGEVKKTVLALNFLETGGIIGSESCEKWSTPYCPQIWHHLHFDVSTL